MAGQLFGVTVEAADGKAPVWNADVRFFCIKQDGKPKAYFFFVSFGLMHAVVLVWHGIDLVWLLNCWFHIGKICVGLKFISTSGNENTADSSVKVTTSK